MCPMVRPGPIPLPFEPCAVLSSIFSSILFKIPAARPPYSLTLNRVIFEHLAFVRFRSYEMKPCASRSIRRKKKKTFFEIEPFNWNDRELSCGWGRTSSPFIRLIGLEIFHAMVKWREIICVCVYGPRPMAICERMKINKFILLSFDGNMNLSSSSRITKSEPPPRIRANEQRIFYDIFVLVSSLETLKWVKVITIHARTHTKFVFIKRKHERCIHSQRLYRILYSHACIAVDVFEEIMFWCWSLVSIAHRVH